jgi:hypothetical protein
MVTIIELLCFVALVGFVAGVLGGLMHWPLWMGVIPMSVCLGLWFWLRRIGHSESKQPDDDQRSKTMKPR